MKAFVISMVVLAVIAVGAAVSLDSLGMSAESVFSSKVGNVRL